ncbi:Bifunctional pinoresinol-lariciresinol reductase 2 [Hyphodiscus hymeniophilus]|uniref:Bifunctional pinoresinol-lariciresinol reductase 2 n=1 Tax=Hyphodiscus hymeniophilus TaxID=353542 RepID=A0A9P6VHC7_9HELO|nr:Bifunctional pinoresinol-lariciresinol reductase 2 [Hyphodiscus hymeniophilus]
MTTIKNVAVIGGAGNLGPSVVKALLEAGFKVTVLSRASSASTFPSTVRTHKTDYGSSESLAEAFKGQDAVVSVITTAAASEQQKIVDAAVKAGVKRFIPSEYGVNTQHMEGGIAKILNGKKATMDLLKKHAAENATFSWTGLSNSMFFDWGLKVGSLGFSLREKTAIIFDSGNEPFNGTNVGTIGLAIASILQHPAKTANRYLNIASFTTTQNTLLKILEEETGEEWTVTHLKTDDSFKSAEEKLAKGDYSAFGDYLKPHLYGDGKGHANVPLANEELGLPKEDLRETIKMALAQ